MNNIKKYFYIIYILLITKINYIFAGKPEIIDKVDDMLPSDGINANNIAKQVGGDIVEMMIKYVAVIAVISLMLGGIMYLISGGEEEKVKKAKNWIIWSLVGVLVSISAMGIIKIINYIKI